MPLRKDRDMPGLLVRCILFFSSYSPLTLIFSILLWKPHPHWAVALLALSIVSMTCAFLYLLRRRSSGGVSQTKITDVQKRDENVVSYIVTYLVPFVTFSLNTLEQVLAILIFFAVLLVLYVNSNMIYINPIFNMAGYHLYEIRIETDDMSHYLITRRPVKPHQLLYFVELSDNVYLQKKARGL